MVREIGAGVLAAQPEVGSRLRIELRRGRGLASSLVTHIQEMGEGRLALKTEGRVYVLSDVTRSWGPEPGEALRIVADLIDAPTVSPSPGDAGTECVRMLPVEPKEERRIRVARLCDSGDEMFGEGELLGELEVGECLRFTSEGGRVQGTSVIEMIRQLSPSCLEVSTSNSRYLVEFLSGTLPR